MAIILKGWESVEDLNSLSAKIKNGETKRLLGYLFFELSALENWEKVSDRIREIKEKREVIKDVPGMKMEPPPIEIEAMEEVLKKIYEHAKEKYAEVTSLGRQRASAWEYDTDETPYRFFRHILKKYAGKLVSESGASG